MTTLTICPGLGLCCPLRYADRKWAAQMCAGAAFCRSAATISHWKGHMSVGHTPGNARPVPRGRDVKHPHITWVGLEETAHTCAALAW